MNSPDTMKRLQNASQSGWRKRRIMSTRRSTIGRRKFLGMGAAAAGFALMADLEAYPQNVNRNSIASDLKITDMRIAVLRGPGGQAIREGNGGPSRAGGLGGVGVPGAAGRGG